MPSINKDKFGNKLYELFSLYEKYIYIYIIFEGFILGWKHC